jgi:deoxycytidylate deaminase
MGPCAKQEVTAIISKGDKVYIGSNWCKSPQKECPRKNLPTGKGYELCKSVCGQENHAEINACLMAGSKAKGGIMFLIGHYYCCTECLEVIKQHGIKKVYIV